MGSLGVVRGEAAALQQHGQRLYQQGSFQAAIEAFTEALSVNDANHLDILDNRAATYTKLAQYDRALRDSRQMIKKDKHDYRGYLRCAKSLLLDNKPEKALEVYAYGLKVLPSVHPRRSLVAELHDKLREKMMAKCQDPFTVLPLELARLVIQDFDFKQLVAILRVSKGWNKFLSSMRDLWMELDFSIARGKIHWSSVRAHIRRSTAMLTKVTLKNISTPSTQRVLEFVSRCPKLEHLELMDPYSNQAVYTLFKGSKRLKTLVVSADTVVPQEYLAKFLASLPLLERIEVYKTKSSPQSKAEWPSKLPHLRSITLGSIEPSRPTGHVPALYIPRREHPSIPYPLANLEELRLDSNPEVFVPYPPAFNPLDLQRLKKLDLSGIFIGDEFALPSSLEYLRIRGGAGAEEFPFSNEPPLAFPNLHTLILSDVPWVTNRTFLYFLLEGKAPLKVLHVDKCFRLHGSTLAQLLCEHSQGLEELNVSHISLIDDKVVEMLAEKLLNLKVLNLTCTEITGISIKRLADIRSSESSHSPIERVFAKGCENVSADAVAYGRANGLEIFA
ncbi:hypothetical protein P170DRAFT_510138 [Aspergillus steynii IBT 23096]|uniref:F-box domain-containing protein n=1 Tax=Aspergillus steynii IBT 23096 TaxID=1392250 RepID=A0A2I2G9Q0_9EURO|nr:uncharacterized protein P170DRAFT_510138 [Aspergillus steynii IBT 23096]PLB49609.1 hypothetical protein P170DRAFT_510138 [Aspergillus steynii IBT 23096]